MLVAFAGGVVGVAAAGLIEYDTLCRLKPCPPSPWPWPKKTAKLIAPLAVLAFTRHRRAADGLVVGVACGAGFAVMETMGYSAVALVQSHQNLVAVEGLLLQRGT